MDGKVNKKVIFGIAAILTIAFLGTIITGIASGWFNTVKTELSSEYYHADAAFNLDSATYERLTREKKSFLVISYLPGCTAKLLQFVKDFSAEHDVAFLSYNFADLKGSSLYDTIKYSPSVAVVSEGRVVAHLDANSNDDVAKYNDYSVFKSWLESLVKF